ncbi:conjugal transfer protein TraF [Puniceicoccaceae bacterium K14]|nr:conjugal transfer protein TraF [Puniceicoccaceae bacterium K14]
MNLNTPQRKLLSTASILALGAFAATPTHAQSQFVGTRSLGMGGTGVAGVNDTTAPYANPAAFPFIKIDANNSSEVEYKNALKSRRNTPYDQSFYLNLDFGGGYRMTGDIDQYVDELIDIEDKINEIDSDNLTSENIVDLLDAVSLLNKVKEPGNAFIGGGNGGFSTQLGWFRFGLRTYAQGYGYVEDVEFTNVGLDIKSSQDLIDRINDISEDDASEFGGISSLTATAELEAVTQFDVEYDPELFKNLTEAQFQQILDAVNNGLVDGVDVAEITNEDVLDGIAQLDEEIGTAIEDGVIERDEVGTITDSLSETIENLEETDGDGSLENNRTSVFVRNFNYVEIPFSFSKRFTENFSMGANVKYMRGRVYGVSVSVFNDDTDDVIDRLEGNYHESDQFGVDLGAMYRMKNLRFGATAKNVNSPSFDGMSYTSFTGDEVTVQGHTIDPQLTVGAAWVPTNFFTAEVNVDTLETEDFGGFTKTQLFKAGAEINVVEFLALRGGYYTNLADGEIGDVFTAGISLDIWAARFDISGARSVKQTIIDGEKAPVESYVNLALNFGF